MIELTMEYLINNFNRAKELDQRFVGLAIRMDDFEKDEVIINEKENFDTKLDYYKKTYDDNLNHKFAAGIRICGFTFGNSFDEIQADLID